MDNAVISQQNPDEMLENSPYSESDVQTALQMTADGVAVKQICDHVGMARQTYYNWKKKGLLTDGVPWDEWLETHHSTEILRKDNKQAVTRIESRDEFWEDQLPKLRAAVENTADKLADGEVPLDADGLKKVVSLIRKIENRGKELAMLQETFMRKTLFAVREEVGQETFKLIREKIKQVQIEQLKEYDEDYAETLLPDA